MLAIAQLLRWDGEVILVDDFGGTTIVGHFNAGDIRLAAGLYFDLLRPVDHGVNSQSANLYARRQGGHLELDGLDDFRPGRVNSANGDRIAPRRQIRRIQNEVQTIALDDCADFRVGRQADNRRLTERGDAAGDDIGDHGVFC